MHVMLNGVPARSLEAIERPPREWRQKSPARKAEATT
jgi:hypothetical protein